VRETPRLGGEKGGEGVLLLATSLAGDQAFGIEKGGGRISDRRKGGRSYLLSWETPMRRKGRGLSTWTGGRGRRIFPSTQRGVKGEEK